MSVLPDDGEIPAEEDGPEDSLSLEDDTPTDQLAPRQSPTRATPSALEPAPGYVLRSRYVLEEVIGRGGTSIIFRARDLHRALPHDIAANFVAIKLLRPEQRDNPAALTRLKREFRQMQCLSHPGIVRVFDLDCDHEFWFLCMELVSGRTVKSWMTSSDRQVDALRIIRECCEALEHAHSLGIVHADLKATNVMVAADGTVKLIDFSSAPNLANCADADSEPNLAVTPLYASPQVLAGKNPERRDDVYSLACLSYSILSGGRHPFGGHPSLEDGRVKQAPTYLRSIPAPLFEVIERGLSAERDRRPSSIAAFLGELVAAERYCRAGSTNFGALMLSQQAIQIVDGVFKEIQPRSRNWLIADRAPGVRNSYRRVRSFARITAMVVALVGAAVVFRLGTHRGSIRAADLASPAAALATPVALAMDNADNSVRTAAPLPDSGVVSFDAPAIRASAAQSLVAVTVKRSATSKPGAFLWRVERGSAYPGVDYPRMAPQLVRFADGQAARTLFIPLITSQVTLLSRGVRTFSVALQQVAGGPALGRFARIKVAIDSPPATRMVASSQVR
jgi:tRNA A-37 threonylcarbamoyl transferase component Bud32